MNRKGSVAASAEAAAVNSSGLTVPDTMMAWVLGDPEESKRIEKTVPAPGRSEALVRVDAVAICATDLEILSHGTPAMFEGGNRENRNKIALELGADVAIDARNEDVVARVKELTGGKGADYVVNCAGNDTTANQALHMTNRGGKICLSAFPQEPVKFDLGYLAINKIYLYGIRGEGRSATHRAMAFMTEKRLTRPRSIPAPSRWKNCQPRSGTPASGSTTR